MNRSVGYPKLQSMSNPCRNGHKHRSGLDGTLEQTAKTQILIVDEHPLVRDGLAQLISRQPDLRCCAQCGTAAEVQCAIAEHSPNLVITDLLSRNGDALELIKALRLQHPDLPILIFSQHDGKCRVEEALRAGALGFVPKDQGAVEVLKAIRTVLGGEVYVARGMAVLLFKKFIENSAQPSGGLAEQLTDRELHVFQLLGVGWSTREIASHLQRSFKTVECHRENIKRKLQLRGAAELISYAMQWAQERITHPVQAIPEPRV